MVIHWMNQFCMQPRIASAKSGAQTDKMSLRVEKVIIFTYSTIEAETFAWV
jgi:hypothetical protein